MAREAKVLRWDRPDDYQPSPPKRRIKPPPEPEKKRARARKEPPRGWSPETADIPGTMLSESDLTTYRLRSLYLLEMGFKCYDAYLRSKLWKKIRKRALKRWPTCYGCGRRATQVHHFSYRKAALKGKLKWLASVCYACHYTAEHCGGLKVGLKEANRRLNAIRSNRLAGNKYPR